MIRHGFSYYDLANMPYAELKFWARKLSDYYEERVRLLEDEA
jgi:hypothetical protein